MNDPGLLSGMLFKNNVMPILEDVRSINLGALYETAVAGQLKALGHKLFYYDNRNRGEVDFLVDDFDTLSVLPIEVKSGRDYTVHSALNHFLNNGAYSAKAGYVLSNEREIKSVGNVLYLPIYFVMFIAPMSETKEILI